ncbi:ras-related protein Rab-34-like isoform X4 [Syngnathus typhle]|uniref:ras-related protein Rab-34-like isoform X4 n=1 Tax=Syngnathus typhle TaxID=161592 RepID=UPI002A6A0840|nr:ras-related protein Rab-34-like isoform X4 [Syngnathus typhle]XP_061155116.1 ras-related protein Rab-34-like isoform X4 [Syngnathus typhle]
MSDAEGRYRQLQCRQSYRGGRRLGRENLSGQQVRSRSTIPHCTSAILMGVSFGTWAFSTTIKNKYFTSVDSSPRMQVLKTDVPERFSRGAFNKNYKATIGVDFDMERFQVLGVPFSLQLWDTAGQERFKCIASTYYRGAQAIIVVFDLSRANSLDHAREWLEDAMKENDPSSVLLFLVGTKKDLSSPEQLGQVEEEAVRMSEEIRAEYWAVSAKSGDGVRDFFLRVASLTFEANVLAELEKSAARDGADVISESLARRLSSTPVLTWFVARDHERPEGQTREEGQLLLT